jgi:hypothetical protein
VDCGLESDSPVEGMWNAWPLLLLAILLSTSGGNGFGSVAAGPGGGVKARWRGDAV